MTALSATDQNHVTDNPPEHQTPRHKIDVSIDMPTPDADVSHEITITLTPKRVSEGNRPSTYAAPLPRPPFPMTQASDTSSDPTADVFGSRTFTEVGHSAAERKGTAANPHDETYPRGDGGLAESEGGLERRWYLVIRGREVGKLYRSWHDVLPLIQAEPGSGVKFLKGSRFFRPLSKEGADEAFNNAKRERLFRVIH